MTNVRRLWRSDTALAALTRSALVPPAVLFRGAVALRTSLYQAGLLRSYRLDAPAISVGNLTVGGTGKTTIAAWFAQALAAQGATPAILMRGYGDDEVLVHRHLTPSAVVVADPDRVRGARNATRQGADVLVLDDGFQHLRARRDVDIVLVSADAAGESRWPLPAGPWREPPSALRRASMALVTAKAASQDGIALLLNRIADVAPSVTAGVARLELDEIVRWPNLERASVARFANERVIAVSAIGDPVAFERQLTTRGLDVTSARYPDHHAFSAEEAQALCSRAGDRLMPVCTLKDAVKLGPVWPRGGPPLWYLSQRVIIERGEGPIAGYLARLLAARRDVGTAPAPSP